MDKHKITITRETLDALHRAALGPLSQSSADAIGHGLYTIEVDDQILEALKRKHHDPETAIRIALSGEGIEFKPN